jgi:hypothetical protein
MGGLVTDLDTIAKQIALNSGIVWDSLNEYPGYNKNYWREQARSLIISLTPGAVFQEPRGTRWDV